MPRRSVQQHWRPNLWATSCGRRAALKRLSCPTPSSREATTGTKPKYYPTTNGPLMDEAEIQLHHEFNHAEASASPKMASPPAHQQLLSPSDTLRSALISGNFSDLTITCGSQRFKVHRVIVCLQSPVLAALCEQSQDLKLIDLRRESPDAMTRMMEYLYTGTYTTPDSDTPPTFSLHTHTAMHTLACTYQVTGLMILAATNFAISLRRVRDLEVYFQSIREVYAAGPSQGPSTSSSRTSSPVPHHPSPPNDDAEEEREEAPFPTRADAPIANGFFCPESLALRAEVVEAAITELAKILNEPLVMARFHQIATEVPEFHVDFLQGLLQVRGVGGGGADVGADDADVDADADAGCETREEGNDSACLVDEELEDGHGGEEEGEEGHDGNQRGAAAQVLPPLCKDCGPRKEAYEIWETCTSCGQDYAHVFH